jgi:hypothetical protein
VSYLPIADPGDSAIHETYRRTRASDADHVLAAVADSGGRAIALEADLADAATPVRLFDVAEARFGNVDILVNNATGWLADTFTAKPRDRFGQGDPRIAESARHPCAQKQLAIPAVCPVAPESGSHRKVCQLPEDKPQFRPQFLGPCRAFCEELQRNGGTEDWQVRQSDQACTPPWTSPCRTLQSLWTAGS